MGAYLNIWDQNIYFEMIGHSIAEERKLLLGSGGMLPGKNFDIWDPQIAGNALKLSIPP